MALDDLQQVNTGTTVPGEQTPPPATLDERADDAPDTASSGGEDVESRARAMGWVPKEEFRGPAERWKDPESFVKDGEEQMPVLRERLRDATRRISDFEAQQRRQQAEFADKMARLERMSATALVRQREQIVGSYEAAKRQAVETGDVTRYEQLQKDQREALNGFDSQAQQAVQAGQQQAPVQGGGDRQFTSAEMAVVNTWVDKNGWFQRDIELNAAAQARHITLLRQKPGLSMEQNLAEVEKFVRDKFPERFGSSGGGERGMSAVEGGSRRATSQVRQKGAADLPADVRRIGERFVQQGLFKDIGEYAKEFWSDNA
jgi:hypothetical protein